MVYFPLRLATLHDILTEYGTQGSITQKKTQYTITKWVFLRPKVSGDSISVINTAMLCRNIQDILKEKHKYWEKYLYFYFGLHQINFNCKEQSTISWRFVEFLEKFLTQIEEVSW